MYYIAQRYGSYDGESFEVIEFSENKDLLEEKAQKLNIKIEQKEKIYNEVEHLVEKFEKSVWFFQSHLGFSKEKAIEKAKLSVDIPEYLVKNIQYIDGMLKSYGLSSNYPQYSVEEIVKADYSIEE